MSEDRLLERALTAALAAAQAAGRELMKRYGGRQTVERKADASPVTEADRAAEAVILATLRAAFPDHAFYGEETGRTGESEFLWLIDPLDGTRSFIRRQPMFSVQIALMHQDEVVLGVSHAPAFAETAWAVRGRGAFLDGRRIATRREPALDRSHLSLGNLKRLAASPRGWSALAELLRAAERVRGYGDFFHYHRLAEGALDAVIESDVHVLDVAALSLIVAEAGGIFTDLQGRPPSLRISSVLAAGSARLHCELRKRLDGAIA